jgi:SAM-dependent methyltransferase
MITLVANCGVMLADILRGDADPLQALFPGGSTELAGSLYRDAPEARVCNDLARETLMAAVTALPRGRRLRVLEVGGGTGGTTAWLAPALPADATEYLFTDVGPLLVAQARERFAGHPFMEFQTLDLEQELSAQGLEGRRFDVIVAANVVHATADLRRTLRSLRDLLAPGGMLLMLEVAAPAVGRRHVRAHRRLVALHRHRAAPELSVARRTQWLDLLSTCGFQAAAVGDERTYARAALLVARRTSEPPRRVCRNDGCSSPTKAVWAPRSPQGCANWGTR